MSLSLRSLPLALVLVAWLAGCSSADDATGCAENQQSACPCTDAHQGVQTCHDGAYSACFCPAGTIPSSPDQGHGGQSGSVDKGTLSQADIESFCQSTYLTFTRLADRCCQGDEKTREAILKHTEIDRTRSQFCTSLLTGSQAIGRITFDSTKVTACAAAQKQTLAESSCGRLLDPDFLNHQPAAPCVEAVEGLHMAGQPCLRDHECVDGLTCVSFGLNTDGICQVPTSKGVCSFKFPGDNINFYTSFKGTYPDFGHHPPCSAGSYCEMAEPEVGSLCRPYKKPGAFCFSSSSSETDACGVGMFCTGEACSPVGAGTKGSPCAIADACARDEFCPSTAPCQAGLYCASTENSYERTCQPRKSSGFKCSVLNDGECQGLCVSGHCADACSGK